MKSFRLAAALTAAVCTAGMLPAMSASAILLYRSDSAILPDLDAFGYDISSEIKEDGTILTTAVLQQNPDKREELHITPDELDFSYRVFEDSFLLSVVPADADAFAAAFDDAYFLREQDDGSYVVAGNSMQIRWADVENVLTWPYLSSWKRADAEAAYAVLMQSETVASVTLLHGYVDYAYHQGAYFLHLFADADVTEADFTFLPENYSVKIDEFPDQPSVRLYVDGSAADVTYEMKYEFLRDTLTEIPAVYAVWFDYWYQAWEGAPGGYEVAAVSANVPDEPAFTTTSVSAAYPGTAETTVSSTTVTTAEPMPTGTHCTTTLLMHDYQTLVEYDNSPMQIGESREIRVYHPAGQIVRNVTVYDATENISYSYKPGSDIITITALAEGSAGMYIMAEGCAFGQYLSIDVIGAANGTTTTADFEAAETTVSSTTVTTAEPMPTGTHCTTTLLMHDYQTLVEYDDSPMQIGESREIRVYHPAGQIVRNVTVYDATENISYSYKPGSDIITITALAEGSAGMYIMAEGCVFGQYLSIDVIGAADGTTTAAESTVTTTETTTTTTATAENEKITDIDQIREMLTKFVEENGLDARIVSNVEYPGYLEIVVEYNANAEVNAWAAICSYIYEQNIDRRCINVVPIINGLPITTCNLDVSSTTTETTTTTSTTTVTEQDGGDESLPQTGIRIPYLQIFLAAFAACTGGAMLYASGVIRRKRKVQ